jgi:hypothetical protein
VLEQAAHEGLARVFLGRFHLRRIGAREQHLRLDMNQCCGHHQELAHRVQVELLHHLNVLEILPRDECDRNVVDVHLVLLD